MNALQIQRLTELENIIERGLKTFVDVGNALLEIRDGRLYQGEYGTFEGYCRDRWNISRPRAYQMMEAASVVSNLSTIVDKPINESQARPLTRFNDEPNLQREIWQEAIDTAPNGKITAAHVQQVANEYVDDWQPSKPHVVNNSGNNEWYTPKEYIQAAYDVLGTIDLDPASSEMANEVVKAHQIYTIDDNGLEYDWSGNVWMNPPYSGDLVSKFTGKLCGHFVAREVEAAIVLVNNATETIWFQQMFDCASAVCFPRSRIKYWGVDGEKNSPLQGQAFLYFGEEPDLFCQVFRQFGAVVSPL